MSSLSDVVMNDNDTEYFFDEKTVSHIRLDFLPPKCLAFCCFSSFAGLPGCCCNRKFQ